MNNLERASAHIKEKKYDKALQLFIEWIEEHPNDPIGYVNAGNLCAELKQMKEAETFLLKAIELDEKTATAFVSLGNIYYEQALYDEAGKMFHHALHLGYEDSDLYYLYGMTYVKTERPLLALPFLQRAVELGDNLDYTFQYGLVLAQLHYLDEAEKVFQDVLQNDETYADASYNLAIIYVHREQFAEANTLLKQTLQHAPNHRLAKKAQTQLEILEREG